MTKITIPSSSAGTRLKDYLTENGIKISAPCGGRGVCKKCLVKVVSGGFVSAVNGEELAPDENGNILACQAVCTSGGAEIAADEIAGDGLTCSGAAYEEREDNGAAYGIALDIGTTTLASALVNLESGKVAATASCLNPQQSYGADVISRIEAAKNGKLSTMQSCLVKAVRGLIEKLVPNDCEIKSLAAAGNTTMLHIFSGTSPVSMGAYPFTPVFTDARTLDGSELGLNVGKVTLLPSVSAFVGGDITAGMYVLKLGKSNVPTLLLDIGTNGEMVLDTGKERGNRLISTSTAAGPALEGANISCGMDGVAGAVSQVERGSSGELRYKTIGDTAARGICGCGLIDLCARLLEDETIDESGYLDDEFTLSGIHVTKSGEIDEGETAVTITQKDIREIQLAKSAIRAGIEALLDSAGMDVGSFVSSGGRVCIAGGLGYYLNPVSAAKIGLLPEEFVESNIVSAVGNTSLAGACGALSDCTAIEQMSRTAKSCESMELNRSNVFNDGFIEYMMFPEQ